MRDDRTQAVRKAEERQAHSVQALLGSPGALLRVRHVRGQDRRTRVLPGLHLHGSRAHRVREIRAQHRRHHARPKALSFVLKNTFRTIRIEQKTLR